MYSNNKVNKYNFKYLQKMITKMPMLPPCLCMVKYKVTPQDSLIHFKTFCRNTDLIFNTHSCNRLFFYIHSLTSK